MLRNVELETEMFDLDQRATHGKDHVWVTGDGRKLLVSQMQPGHLANAVDFMRKKLREVDDSIRELATKLAADPSQGSSIAQDLETIVSVQTELENRLEILFDEEDRRKRAVDRARRLRGEVITQEA